MPLILWYMYKKDKGSIAVKANLFGLIFVCGLALCMGACEDNTGQDPHLTGMKKAVSLDGVDIYYRIKGVGNYTLVFVHGWCNDMTYWKNQIPAFTSGYQAVALDLAGHGLSGMNRKSWSMEAFGGDVVSVITEESLDRIILIGHGMGGAVILEAARIVPEKVIGLVGVDTFQDHYMKNYPEEQIDFFVKPWQEDFKNRMREYAVETYFPDHVDQELMKEIILDLREAPSDVALDILKHVLRYNGAQAFQEIKVPIRGINSKLHHTSYEVAGRNADFFDWIYQSGSGHFPMLENPDFFNRLLAGRLEEIVLDLYERQDQKPQD
ncbi:MAG: alpha/beta fold hydrolase [Candidatus Aminicenantes bacterium]|nr:alpha/beta fold hydrolase [Candidatus Aminicenantes bacterium]